MARKPTKLPAQPAIDEAVALVLPNAMSYDQWLDAGRELAGRKRSIDWMIGDWLTHGREHIPEQIELALPNLIDDDRLIRRIEKTVKAFPPHLRDPGLSFDHHAHVADMPVQQALPLLKKAKAEKITARKFRGVVMDAKVDTGQILPREQDWEDDALLAMVRAWNRAPRTSREDFAEMVRESSGGLIEFEPSKEEA
jgi:hypothetical protein